MKNARSLVLKALVKTECKDSYSNILIDNMLSKSELSNADKAFATALYYGVIERKITLLHCMSRYLRQPVKKLDPYVSNCLLMGFYQLLYMDKVPQSAAVNESIKLIKASKFKHLSGLCNAVLRSFLRDGKRIDLPNGEIERMSVEYSVPQWIAQMFTEQYGGKCAKGILRGFVERRELSIKVNTLKISVHELEGELSKYCEVARHPLVDTVLLLSGAGEVRKLFGYEQGYFHVQDAAGALCAQALCAQPGERVLDVCAAPGGKSFSIAQDMGDKGEVLALDLLPKKVRLIEEGAGRLGINCIKSFVNDAAAFSADLGTFNKVLCDLPCSGLGILGKKPEIRYKNVAFLDNLPNLQYDLLWCSKRYVAHRGILVYSTCTLNERENNILAQRFLQNSPEFEPYPIFPKLERCAADGSHTITLLPHIHNTDGFFISAFLKTGESCE